MIIFLSLTIGLVAGYLLGIWVEEGKAAKMYFDLEDELSDEINELAYAVRDLEQKLATLTPTKKVPVISLKTTSLDKILKENMKDPKFKASYEKETARLKAKRK